MKTKAEEPGTCPACGRSYKAGAVLDQADGMDAPGHPSCASAVRAKARILAGGTYRSGAASSWRLGSAPRKGKNS